MSVLDKLKQMLKGHEEQAGRGTDKGDDILDDRTQRRYSGQIDTARDTLKERFGRDEGNPPRT